MITEYRVQRKDVAWGRGQGYYIIAISAREAISTIARQRGMPVSNFIAKPWKRGETSMTMKRIKWDEPFRMNRYKK